MDDDRTSSPCGDPCGLPHTNFRDRLLKPLGHPARANVEQGHFRDLLQNKFYIGMVRHFYELNEGQHKQVITRALYDRCLEVRENMLSRRASTPPQLIEKTATCSSR